MELVRELSSGQKQTGQSWPRKCSSWSSWILVLILILILILILSLILILVLILILGDQQASLSWRSVHEDMQQVVESPMSRRFRR